MECKWYTKLYRRSTDVITINDIDILLLSETHLTNTRFVKFIGYNLYFTNHPDGTAHGGTGVIIKSNIKHYELGKYKLNYLKATT